MQKMVQWAGKHTTILFIFWCMILTILYSALSIIRHMHFQSGGFDLGIYDQAVWQYSRFLYPFNTIKDRFILGDHLTLTLPLLAPLYWIWNDVRILLLFQSFWIAMSSLAVYLIAIKRGLGRLVALSIGTAYSLFYGFQYLIYSDFHPVPIGIGLLAWLVYAVEIKRRKWMIVLGLLALLTQENMGLAVAGLGLMYIGKKHVRNTAVAMIAMGISYSILAVWIVGRLSPVGFEYSPQLPSTIVEYATRLFDDPQKIQVWGYSLAWFSFLPVFSPGAMLAVILDLGQYFVTGQDLSRMWSAYMHHRGILAVFLVIGTLDALGWLVRRRISAAIVALVVLAMCLILQYQWHLPLNKLAKCEFWRSELWMQDNRNLVSTLDPSASVATQQNIVPHISHRQNIYLIYPRQREGQEGLYWWLEYAGDPSYLLVDTRPGQWETQTLTTQDHWQEAITAMEQAGAITLQTQVGSARLYMITN